MREKLFSILIVFFALIISFGLAELALRCLIKPKVVLAEQIRQGLVTSEPDYIWNLDKEKGWIIKPNVDFWYESPYGELKVMF